MIIDEEDFDEITIEEDIALSKLADKRLAEAKYWIKHEDAWDIPGIANEYCCVVQDPCSMSFLRKQESSIKRDKSSF